MIAYFYTAVLLFSMHLDNSSIPVSWSNPCSSYTDWMDHEKSLGKSKKESNNEIDRVNNVGPD